MQVVYGPPPPALPGPGTAAVVVVSVSSSGRSPSSVAAETVRRLRVRGGTVELFTDGSGHAIAANVFGVDGLDATVRFEGKPDVGAATAALGSLRVATSKGRRALVLGRPPAGLVLRYGPAPEPPGPTGPSLSGNFANFAATGRRIAVVVGRRSPVTDTELAWGLGSGRFVTVGSHRAVLMVERADDQPPSVLVVWQPAEGVFVMVSGSRVEEQEVLRFARSLEPVSERRWKSFMEDHGVDWRHPGRPPDATGLG
jgi:hypothetical protein